MASASPYQRFSTVPAAHGLYDPAREHDACGLAMVATLRGAAGHDIIQAALGALRNLEHRGAIGSDAGTGDGAGILTQIPDEFLRAVTAFALPPVGAYAVGMAFLPTDDDERELVWCPPRAGQLIVASTVDASITRMRCVRVGSRSVAAVGELLHVDVFSRERKPVYTWTGFPRKRILSESMR